MEAEMEVEGYNFSRLEKMAQIRVRLKHIVDGLYSIPEKRVMTTIPLQWRKLIKAATQHVIAPTEPRNLDKDRYK